MKNDSLTNLANLFASILAKHLAPLLAPGPRRPLAQRQLDMACRIPRCKQRSRGPRFRYMCQEHSRLPVSEQRAAVAAYREA